MAYQAGVTLTVLFDNHEFLKGLQSSWGFSCLIEGTAKVILFDTGGNGDILLSNMSKLGVRPWTIDIVVISNCDWDHVGGLRGILEYRNDVPILVPASLSEGLKKPLGGLGASFVEVHEPQTVCGRVWSSGDLGGDVAEQALVVDTGYGCVVLTGCAHPGIVSVAERVHSVGQTDIALLMGGFHLLGATSGEVSRVAHDLRRLWVQRIGPCHCTGASAQEILKREYQPSFLELGAGSRVNLPWV